MNDHCYTVDRTPLVPVDQGFVFEIDSPSESGLLIPTVVVTPTCDIRQQKLHNDEVTLLEVVPLTVFLAVLAERHKIPLDSSTRNLNLDAVGKDKRKSLQNDLSQLVNGNLAALHYTLIHRWAL